MDTANGNTELVGDVDPSCTSFDIGIGVIWPQNVNCQHLQVCFKATSDNAKGLTGQIAGTARYLWSTVISWIWQNPGNLPWKGSKVPSGAALHHAPCSHAAMQPCSHAAICQPG
jgi:hypothetical protein